MKVVLWIIAVIGAFAALVCTLLAFLVFGALSSISDWFESWQTITLPSGQSYTVAQAESAGHVKRAEREGYTPIDLSKSNQHFTKDDQLIYVIPSIMPFLFLPFNEYRTIEADADSFTPLDNRYGQDSEAVYHGSSAVEGATPAIGLRYLTRGDPNTDKNIARIGDQTISHGRLLSKDPKLTWFGNDFLTNGESLYFMDNSLNQMHLVHGLETQLPATIRTMPKNYAIIGDKAFWVSKRNDHAQAHSLPQGVNVESLTFAPRNKEYIEHAVLTDGEGVFICDQRLDISAEDIQVFGQDIIFSNGRATIAIDFWDFSVDVSVHEELIVLDTALTCNFAGNTQWEDDAFTLITTPEIGAIKNVVEIENVSEFWYLLFSDQGVFEVRIHNDEPRWRKTDIEVPRAEDFRASAQDGVLDIHGQTYIHLDGQFEKLRKPERFGNSYIADKNTVYHLSRYLNSASIVIDADPDTFRWVRHDDIDARDANYCFEDELKVPCPSDL